MNKENGIIPEPYNVDANGLYNEAVYQSTGEKFRPIDVRYGRLIVLTPGVVHEIAERRNSRPGLGGNNDRKVR